MNPNSKVDLFRGLALGLAAIGVACSSARSDSTSLDEASEFSIADTEGAGRPELAAIHTQFPIVFHSDRGGQGLLELYVMSPEAGALDAIVVGRGNDYYQPRWSPDGRKLAFRRDIDGNYAEVGLIAADGTQEVTLTRGEDPGLRNRPPAWSPDGERIAFDSLRAGTSGIWVMPRLGGEPERLLPALTAQHREIAWSPDGDRVAYSARTGDTRQRDLFVAEPGNPSAALNLTQGKAYAPTFLRWSPDGSRVVFASAAVLPDGSPEPEAVTLDGSYSPPDSEIFVSYVDTGELVRLTDNSEIDVEPAWAPDGEHIIFTRGTLLADGRIDPDLWIMSLADPGAARSLIADDDDDPTEEGGADWYWPPR